MDGRGLDTDGDKVCGLVSDLFGNTRASVSPKGEVNRLDAWLAWNK